MAADEARLVLNPPEGSDGAVRFAATIHEADGTSEQLWWHVPDAWADVVTTHADPFVIGLIFQIMSRERPVRVAGRVSPSLLARLELFMAIWRIWSKGRYKPVAVFADDEAELPLASQPGAGLVSFSGGVDSCFTIYRHVRRLAGRQSRRIAAGVFQHGFDVALDAHKSDQLYARLLTSAQAMLGSLDLPCIPVTTNFLELTAPWKDSWGAQLASGMALFSRRYDSALIANDLHYAWMGTPWPHHPLTTPLLSSDRFALNDDGGEFSRSDKAGVISAWPEAMKHLHVCFGLDIPGSAANCCRCEKCTRTILAFRAAGVPRPEAFPEDAGLRQIRQVRWSLPTRTYRWQQIVDEATSAGLGGEAWVRAARHAIRHNEWRVRRARLQRPFLPIRNAFRRILRGSALSRRELERQLAQDPARSRRS
jgi:hypothetical protein